MLVNEEFRKCVTFLYADQRDSATGVVKRAPIGSAFFVAVELLEGSYLAGYVVTARHLIDGSEVLWLRMRLKDGGFRDLPVSPDAWEEHPHTDVAVAPLPLGDENFDLVFIGTQEFAPEAFVEQHEVGEGDDVFFSGLFVGHYGEGAPQPIIRFGNVALMPREPVRIEISRRPRTFANVEAYLTEARSWGGQSGSPAFLTFSPDRYMGGGLVVGGSPPFALLGLVQGIWKDPESATAPDPSGEGVVEINMGISVVVPAYKILETLMSDELVRERKEQAAELEGSRGSLVSPAATSAEAGPNQEFEQFENLTRKLVNVPKKETDEKRKGGS